MVEAMPLTQATLSEVMAWTGGFLVNQQDDEDPTRSYISVLYDTPEGRKRISEGEYLVHSGGSYYAAKPLEFANRFELVR